MEQEILKVRNGSIDYDTTSAMCESCGGSAIGAFEPYYNDESTTWCVNCADANYDDDQGLNDAEKERMWEIHSHFDRLRNEFGRKLIELEIPKYISSLTM